MSGEKQNEEQVTMVKITNLSKEYKMFNRKIDRLVETIVPGIKRHGTFEALKDFSLELKKEKY